MLFQSVHITINITLNVQNVHLSLARKFLSWLCTVLGLPLRCFHLDLPVLRSFVKSLSNPDLFHLFAGNSLISLHSLFPLIRYIGLFLIGLVFLLPTTIAALQIFHRHTLLEIGNKIIIKYPISPWMHRYTTLFVFLANKMMMMMMMMINALSSSVKTSSEAFYYSQVYKKIVC